MEEQTSNNFLFICIAPLTFLEKIHVSEQKSEKTSMSTVPLWGSLISAASCPNKGVEQTITVLSALGRPETGMCVLQQCRHCCVTPLKDSPASEHKLDLKLEDQVPTTHSAITTAEAVAVPQCPGKQTTTWSPTGSRELNAWCRSIFRTLILCHRHKLLNLKWQCNCSNSHSSLPNAYSKNQAKWRPARGRKSETAGAVFHRIVRKIRLTISSAYLFGSLSLKLTVALVMSSVHWIVRSPLLLKISQFWWASLEEALWYFLWQSNLVGHLCFYKICSMLLQIQQAQEYVSMLWFIPFFSPLCPEQMAITLQNWRQIWFCFVLALNSK